MIPVTDAMVEAALDKFFDDAVGWRDVTDQQSMIADMRAAITAALAVSGVQEVVEALNIIADGCIVSSLGDVYPSVMLDPVQVAKAALARVTEPQQ